jgi:hypothetical protein
MKGNIMERLLVSQPETESLLAAVLRDFPYLADETENLLQKPSEGELDEVVSSFLGDPESWELVERLVRYPHFAYLTRHQLIYDENSPLGSRFGLPREICDQLHTYRHYDLFELKAVARVPVGWDKEDGCPRLRDVGPRFQLRPALNFLTGKNDTTGVIFQCLPWERYFPCPDYLFPVYHYDSARWRNVVISSWQAVVRDLGVAQVLMPDDI